MSAASNTDTNSSSVSVSDLPVTVTARGTDHVAGSMPIEPGMTPRRASSDEPTATRTVSAGCAESAIVNVASCVLSPTMTAVGAITEPGLAGVGQRLGISRNVLTNRLDTLVANDILERRPYDEPRGRYDYVLTDKGRALWPVMTALRQWGDDWIYGAGNEPLLIEHRNCGSATTAQMTCDACGEVLDARSVRVVPGPGATDGAVHAVGARNA